MFLTEKACARGYDPLGKTIMMQTGKKSKKDIHSGDGKGILSAMKITKVGVPVQMNGDLRVQPVKSFSHQLHNTPICDYLLPQSHYARQLPAQQGLSKKRLECKNLWILKPSGLNRGQGIHVVDSLKQCKKLMLEYFFGKEYHVGGQVPNSDSKQDRQASTPSDDDEEDSSVLSHHRVAQNSKTAQAKRSHKFINSPPQQQGQNSHLLKCT